MTLIRPTQWDHKEAQRLSDFKYNDGTCVPMFRIDSFHILTQLVGYIKHINPHWDLRGFNFEVQRLT